jgi:hypothetical protein
MKFINIISYLVLYSLFNIHPAGSSSDLSTNNIKVIFFLDPKCPISQKYTKVINQLANKYKSYDIDFSLTLLIIGSTSTNELISFTKNYAITIPYTFSKPSIQMVNYGITTTPECLVLKNQSIVYHGAIDDWFYGLGKHLDRPNECFLENVLDSILKKKVLMYKYKKPIGCIIEY